MQLRKNANSGNWFQQKLIFIKKFALSAFKNFLTTLVHIMRKNFKQMNSNSRRQFFQVQNQIS